MAYAKYKKFIREKRIYCGEEYLEVDIFPTTEKRKGKRKKKKESAPKQKNLNEKNSKRYFVQLGNTNFGKNDHHISCTYDDEHLPETVDEALKNAGNYIRRLKRKMKKETGQDLKYILVTEYTLEEGEGQQDKPVRIHHHIIINGGLDRTEIELLWSDRKKKGETEPTPIGFCNADRLQPNENGIEGLCKYIQKRKKSCKMWSCSQNLDKPVVKENNSKYSRKKVQDIVRNGVDDYEYWRKQYPGYEPTNAKAEYNDITGWSVYIKLRKVRDKTK